MDDVVRHGIYVGIDVGTTYLHYAAVSDAGQVLYNPRPLMHFSDVPGVVEYALEDVWKQHLGPVVCTAFTGSNLRFLISEVPSAFYRFDTVAIPTGASHVQPSARFVLHLGAKDPYFFEVDWIENRLLIREWRTGSKCGGGSGILVEKQCRRLFADQVQAEPTGLTGIARYQWLQDQLEVVFKKACMEAQEAKSPAEFLARCGVVIQSDLIHKQNEGVKRPDNLAGLFRTVARNYKVDVLGTREICREIGDKLVVGTGGLMANDVVHSYLEELLGVSIVRDAYIHNVAAIGVALLAARARYKQVLDPATLEGAMFRAKGSRPMAPSLRTALPMVSERSEQLSYDIPFGTEVVIGVDGGSTTTKAAMVDVKTGRLLDKIYIKTHGDPEGALKKVMRYMARHREKVVVRGVGATGSARRLYERILLSPTKARQLAESGIAQVDKITDEITCHAIGVRHFDPTTDTIFEVGGQDMKFTRFAPDGTIKEAKMNYSCQAGSGQTLENMAEVIGLKVESTLQEAALRAESVPIIDSTCGVFMEMDEQRLLAEGFSKEQIAAAIVRGTAASYFHKFVGGSRNVGQVCSAQGGPALGKAFLASLAQVSGCRINAYPHREIFGAWGQALDIIETIKKLQAEGRPYGTAFRGWEVIETRFQKDRRRCRELFGPSSCGVRDCMLDVFQIDQDMIVSGGFCPRGDSQAGRRRTTDYVRLFHKLLEQHFGRYGLLLSDLDQRKLDGEEVARTIGIKRSTATLGPKAIWAAALLRSLGFVPVLSPMSNPEIAKVGVDYSRTEFCIARKLATGHAAILCRDPRVRFLFNPSFIEVVQPRRPDLKYCIYTESEGFVLNDALSLDKARQLNPILHLDDRWMLVEEIWKELQRIGQARDREAIIRALEVASKAEQAFLADLYAAGDRFMAGIESRGGKAYVGLGRDYVVLDPEASSNSGAMFSQDRCLDYIPQIFLEHRFRSISLDGIADNEYWVESVKILKANIMVAAHPQLFGIRLMNFACGPDSLKIYQERKIQEEANKPLLILLTDAQTNNAPFVTRTEAHERVVEQATTRPLEIQRLVRSRSGDDSDHRVWLIPFMGNASFIGAAGLKHFGIEAMVLPTSTPLGYELARRHIWTEVCYPLKGVVGDALAFLKQKVEAEGLDTVRSRYLLMLPTTSGPCRFGKYTEMVRHFLEQEGLQEVPVVGPSSENDYVDVPFPRHFGAAERIRCQQVLFRGVYAVDLLEDTYLRFRPYVIDRLQADQVRKQRLEDLIAIVEKGAPMERLIAWGRETVEAFEQLPVRITSRFPLILYIGEIYMRHHDPYTGFVVDKLEQAELEVVRDPVTGWLEYVNQTAIFQARRHLGLGWRYGDWARVGRNVLPLVRSVLKGRYMRYVCNRLSEPFQKVLEGRHILPTPMEMLETLERNHECHRSIEGESPISTAIAYYLMKGLVRHGPSTCIAGIFHVGPFTCMQETVATAKIEAMLKEYRKHRPDVVLPVIHAFFGDSPNPNLEAEIAVFREQCYQNMELMRLGKQASISCLQAAR
ncbi:MAG: BadF/BadG/BcrA/BcrD ATPase family protein [Sedimentisphaerales bacterium]|nr:BadF/BadG/BcrA/BcrD ATPase family protein [Sedimentisphaerales bacterium]